MELSGVKDLDNIILDYTKQLNNYHNFKTELLSYVDNKRVFYFWVSYEEVCLFFPNIKSSGILQVINNEKETDIIYYNDNEMENQYIYELYD